jgi:hypothetical protein
MEARMDDEDSKEVVRRLFALLTAKMEDGGTIAAEGQAPSIDSARAHDLANRVHGIGQECMILADAIIGLSANMAKAS